MNTKLILIVAVIVCVIFGGGLYFALSNRATPVPPNVRVTPKPAPPRIPLPPGIQQPSPTPAPSTSGQLAPQTAPSSASTHAVSIKGFSFSPSMIIVKKGDTVIWTNNDTAPHTVTSVSASAGFDSGTLNKGHTYSFTFTQTGTFSYVCTFHPSMTGSVLVQ